MLRLTLVGDLDRATAPDFEQYLRVLKRSHTRVNLDLSRLEFIDSAGARVLCSVAGHDRDGWLSVEPEVPRHAGRLFELVEMSRLLASA